MAATLEGQLDLAITVHAICMILCFYREAFSAKTDNFNKFMVMCEIAGTFIYLMMIFEGMGYYITFYVRAGPNNDNFGGLIEVLVYGGLHRDLFRSLLVMEPDYFMESGLIRSWAGTSLEWMYVETLVFAVYLATMLILLIQSRFMNIAADSSRAFAPGYMGKMLDEIARPIADRIHLDHVQTHGIERCGVFRRFVNQQTDVDAHAVAIRVALDQDGYERICLKKCFGDKHYVCPEEAEEWLAKYVVGGITRDELD